MSDTTSHGPPPPGSISWTEIPVQDVDRAKKFYKDIFGWDYIAPPATSSCPTPDNANPTSDVFMFQKGTTYGSFRKLSAENHLSPGLHPSNEDKKKVAVTVTINTEDMDGTLEKIVQAGGEVWIPKRQIPGENMGYLAYFLDTEKNVMGVWAMH